MHWISAISHRPEPEQAAQELGEKIREGLAGGVPDLLVVYVTSALRESYLRIPSLLREAFPGAIVFGCSGGGVIGGGVEAEEGTAITVTAASLPGVLLHPFHLPEEAFKLTPQALGDKLREQVDLPEEPACVILHSEPFSSDTPRLLTAVDHAFPATVTVGGVASGGTMPGQHVLYAGDKIYGSGAVGLAMTGAVAVDSVVAQGCRPIGSPMFVTRCEDGVIVELDGRRPSEVLQDLHDSLPPSEQAQMRRSLFLGLVMSPHHQHYRSGDFLVRNLIGLDSRTGALAVHARVSSNTVVQFHIRDADTSAEELGELLNGYNANTLTGAPAGALMYACLGRGRNLYGKPNHDSEVFFDQVGPLPLGGFFCNGEIGPVHGTTHLHGYTSSFAMFYTPQPN